MSSAPIQQQVQAFGRAIAEYLSGYRNKLNGFHWPIESKCVEEAARRKLLSGMSVEGGFAETMQLRQAVAVRAREIQAWVPFPKRIEDLADLAKFVISDWGNLNGNDAQTIVDYAQRFTGIEVPFDDVRCVSDLRAAVLPKRQRGLFRFAGIASWSKWLNFVWNDWALIYDARIAFALDAVHFISRIDAPIFPVPPGRNPRLANFDAQGSAAFGWLANYAHERLAGSEISARLEAAMVPESEAYSYYLAVMAEAHRLLWPLSERRPLVHTEMLLFKLSIEDIADDFAREMLVRLSTPARAIHVGADMRKPGETTIPNMESGEGFSIGASGIECFE
ncbi:hypothetical protein [Burkholderia pseudomallei]|uniref:hypothetical protein n=1 Tax=Burkholderia pseudomallei TaxID=28450 RepID=UPI0003D8A901|nr:hypothetical protein [Burkholderia pseudomallei]AHE27158.1 hypothetical protein BBJ_3141 [Burkholderia pseudomallei NCTC 13178]ALJ71658.1 hypothetical protein TR70_2130 [Burkholderia pseudomallei]KGC48110.1 hypothetical protein DO65_3920 [Burkholderia pseudomallei]KGD52984.1 hypothetical protein DP49_70 [Burkholderia pseudomallei]